MSIRNHQTLVLIQGFIGGVLGGLGLSQFGIVFMPLALALLWSASKKPLAGFIWGAIAVLLSHRWLLSLHPLNWIGVPAPFSLPIAISIWLFCGMAAGLLVGLWSWIGQRPFLVRIRDCGGGGQIFYAISLAAIWGLAEVALACLPLFWIGIGASLLPGDRALAGLARWFGVGGLAVLNLLIAFWIRHVFLAINNGLEWKKSLSIGLVFVVFAHAFGWSLLATNQSVKQTIPVALWQPATPIREKFSLNHLNRLPDLVQDSLNRSTALGASWLLAPEGTLMANQQLLSRAPIPLLSGGFRLVRGAKRSSVLVFEEGKSTFSSFVDKHRLVPLGEWVPNLFEFHVAGLSAVGGLEAGEPSRLLSWSGPNVAVAICYELSNGHGIAQAVVDGAEWIMAAANLDPYPISLQRQFIALAQLRSIETSRDLISVANTGPSALVFANGEVSSVQKPFDEGIGLVELNLRQGKTGYLQWRESPLLVLLIIGLFGPRLLLRLLKRSL